MAATHAEVAKAWLRIDCLVYRYRFRSLSFSLSKPISVFAVKHIDTDLVVVFIVYPTGSGINVYCVIRLSASPELRRGLCLAGLPLRSERGLCLWPSGDGEVPPPPPRGRYPPHPPTPGVPV